MDDPANRGVRFGYRAHWPEVHVKWSVSGPDAPAHAERIRAAVHAVFGEAQAVPVVELDDDAHALRNVVVIARRAG